MYGTFDPSFNVVISVSLTLSRGFTPKGVEMNTPREHS